jgi:hypothetical protein
MKNTELLKRICGKKNFSVELINETRVSLLITTRRHLSHYLVEYSAWIGIFYCMLNLAGFCETTMNNVRYR